MIDSLASLCILSYNRPGFLEQAVDSARDNAGAPLEIIVNDDGSNHPDCYDLCNTLLGSARISKLIFNPPGHNQGVGESVRVAFGTASGDVLIKADQDLIFRPNWLKRALDILWNVVEVDGVAKRVGMVGLFHYHHDPVDTRKMRIQRYQGWESCHDFCGSAFLITREVYEECGPIPTHSDAFAEDVDLKGRVKAAGYLLALPEEDLADNRGFGVGPSTVVTGTDGDGGYKVQKIHHSPIMYHADELQRRPDDQ